MVPLSLNDRPSGISLTLLQLLDCCDAESLPTSEIQSRDGPLPCQDISIKLMTTLCVWDVAVQVYFSFRTGGKQRQVQGGLVETVLKAGMRPDAKV